MLKYLLAITILFGEAGLLIAQQPFEDAVQLAARSAAALNESAEISNNMAAELAVALEAIALDDSDPAYMVTQRLNIHTFPYANTSNIRVYLDASAKWAKQLADDKKELEQTPLREWASLHNLSISSREEMDGIVMLELKSSDAKNMKYIANEVSFESDVIMVEVPAPSGDGHDIQAKRVHNGWMITYIYKYKDCLSGCKKQYQWQFGVSNDGLVEFMGAYGEMPPVLLDESMMVLEEIED